MRIALLACILLCACGKSREVVAEKPPVDGEGKLIYGFTLGSDDHRLAPYREGFATLTTASTPKEIEAALGPKENRFSVMSAATELLYSLENGGGIRFVCRTMSDPDGQRTRAYYLAPGTNRQFWLQGGTPILLPDPVEGSRHPWAGKQLPFGAP